MNVRPCATGCHSVRHSGEALPPPEAGCRRSLLVSLVSYQRFAGSPAPATLRNVTMADVMPKPTDGAGHRVQWDRLPNRPADW